MRGQRALASPSPPGEERAGEGRPGNSPPPPAKLPSKKWRDLILQVWHTDPLICPKCQHPMRVIAVIDQRAVIEKILRHLGQWNGTPPLACPFASKRCGGAVDPRTLRRRGSDA